MNIHSVHRKAYKITTDSNHSCSIAPNIFQRRFDFEKPNQVRVGDIACIPASEGWLYLAMVNDLRSRKIVGCAFSNHIYTQLTLDSLNMAARRELP